MKKVISELYRREGSEWIRISFKPFRNEHNELVLPKAEFILAKDAEELELVVGDVVAE